MDSGLITVGLPIALAIIMFGLGLSLTVGDFARIGREPRAVVLALAVQVLVLPVVAFGLVKGFGLSPLLAVGVMLLAASPGGTTANLFSHLFRGDIALNITLTAINSVLAAFTIPLITNFAIRHFGAEGELGLQFGKVAGVVALVLVPVAIGMAVRSRRAELAARADRPVRVFSIVVLVAIIIGAVLQERENIFDYLSQVGLVTGLFCLLSLTIGYGSALLLRLSHAQAIAASMEIGIHNTTIALTIAISILGSTTVAMPSAVYSLLMYLLATAFGFAITRGRKGPGAASTPAPLRA
ncbi:bile acid:sodium symporter family protein [Janibacter cremeus]|uniref:bile acid:sodium symporter family protein n=1 Tax=Janibacter cremeus TaxID=1285192 RepID=UPI0023F9D27A|nr:bile acid:sodium symporter family protein [Janibacter cremeus]WEV78046.1 bile acid:sodium symporter family protein [Janibacter cremeus]